MINKINSFLVLFLFWLLMSGMVGALMISLGVASCVLVLWICNKMDIIKSRKYLPITATYKGWLYSLWLMKEIVVSSFAVSFKVFQRNPQISPKMGKMRTKQNCDFGLMLYGNSITLTPGTITTNIEGNKMTVHALVADDLQDLDHKSGGGEMDRKVKVLI